MINVVFLLLIFFLMTAQIAPPPPLEVELPSSDSDEAAEGPATLYLAADGTLAFREARGDAVFATLAAEPPETLLIRADAAVPAARIAELLPRLAAVGITETAIVTTR
ncbi:ExbD/TolR family protein [Pontivivens ytuae]|nr:biopolymer transporter ExbD [Pontivivens ytuae]